VFIKYRAGPDEPVAEVMGFNVHAGRDLVTRDRYRLERLCRYLVRRRPPGSAPMAACSYLMEKLQRGTRCRISAPLLKEYFHGHILPAIRKGKKKGRFCGGTASRITKRCDGPARLQRFLVVMKAWSAPGRPSNVGPFCDDKFQTCCRFRGVSFDYW
jgi:hypothetical protein